MQLQTRLRAIITFHPLPCNGIIADVILKKSSNLKPTTQNCFNSNRILQNRTGNGGNDFELKFLEVNILKIVSNLLICNRLEN